MFISGHSFIIFLFSNFMINVSLLKFKIRPRVLVILHACPEIYIYKKKKGGGQRNTGLDYE